MANLISALAAAKLQIAENRIAGAKAQSDFVALPVRLNRLRKNGEREPNSPKIFPQGLKPALILRHVRHG
jgi:hypothetical protein